MMMEKILEIDLMYLTNCKCFLNRSIFPMYAYYLLPRLAHNSFRRVRINP